MKLIVYCITLILAFLAVPYVHAQEFQSSESLRLRLGIRDKAGQIGSYQATFSVKGPEGLAVKKSITVSADEFGYVTFPDDFGTTHLKPGKYSWEAVVNDKKVVGGQFEKIGSFVLKVLP